MTDLAAAAIPDIFDAGRLAVLDPDTLHPASGAEREARIGPNGRQECIGRAAPFRTVDRRLEIADAFQIAGVEIVAEWQSRILHGLQKIA
jgi:hypothetical protein